MILRFQKTNEQSNAFRLNRLGNINFIGALKNLLDPVGGAWRSKTELTGKLIPRPAAGRSPGAEYLLEGESRDYVLKLNDELKERARAFVWDEVWVEGYFEDDPTEFVVRSISKAVDEDEVAVRTVSF